jgi:hypothetical protein
MSQVPAVRWREDTGWEFRCEVCTKRGNARFWPLTDEFWDKARGMGRCRSCHRSHDKARAKRLYIESTTFRERKREYVRRYRAANPEAQRLIEKARWERIKADPERFAKYSERARERQRRYRERQKEAA